LNIEVNDRLISFLLFLPVFLISLAIHEYSHAFAAYRFGDMTAKNAGRLTLNPFKHLDLIGSVLMPLVSFASGAFLIGWAKPVPVNPNNFENRRMNDAVVSFAGPFSNLFLAFVLSVAASIINGHSELTQVTERILQLLSMGAYFNVFLFVFNLLPIPPLDGSHILFDIYPNKFTARYLSFSAYGFIILIMFIYSPLWSYLVKIVNFIYNII